MSTRLKPYPSYKESGVEWLGRIPAQWQVERTGFHIDLLTGFPFQSELFSHEHGVALVRGDNVTEGELRWGDKTRRWPHATDALQRFFLKANDLLIGMDGSKVGKNYALVREQDLPLMLVQRVARLRVAPTIDVRFLFYFVGSEPFRTWVALRKTDPAIPHISPADIRLFPISIPSIFEQQSIASFLDRETGNIDALVAKKERLIELLQEKRTALISHAVTQGLNPNAPTKDSGIPWLGRIPAHWEAGRLKVRLRMVEQGWSPQCENRPAEEGEWGVLKVGCMNGSVYRESENKALPTDITPARGLEIRVGDVLMSRSNTVELVGSVGIVHNTQGKILLCDKLFRLVFDQRGLLPDYAVHLLRSPVARRQIEAASSGASPSMKNISNGAVAGLLLPFPPYEEQPTIVAWISRNATKLDALISKVRTAMERLQEYRTALISAAVTGQIDVRRASVLPNPAHPETSPG